MEHDWRSLDDDREVSESYAARYPDAVYDAADPDWWDILYLDEEDGGEIIEESEEVLDDGGFDDVADDGGEEYGGEGIAIDEWEWDESDMIDDDGYYEVEIGIDYGEDT